MKTDLPVVSPPETVPDPLSPVAVTGARIGELPDRDAKIYWYGPNGLIPELVPDWFAVLGPAGTVIGYVKSADDYWRLPPEQLATTAPPDREVWDEAGTRVIGCHLDDGSYASFPDAYDREVHCEG